MTRPTICGNCPLCDFAPISGLRSAVSIRWTAAVVTSDEVCALHAVPQVPRTLDTHD